MKQTACAAPQLTLIT